MRSRALIVITAASLLLLSCSGSERERPSPEVRAVQATLVREFPGTVVGVKLTNGSHLDVNFVNSPLKELPAAEREAKAKEIAKFAFDSYVERDKIKSVRVAFVVLSTFVVLVTQNNSSDAFTFDAAELSGA